MSRRKKLEFNMSYKEFWIRFALTVVIILATCLIFFLCGGMNIFKSYAPKDTIHSKDFEVHFIDVGQGDSTLIRFSDGKTMLVDCGKSSAGNSLVSYLTEVFKEHSVEAIDYLVLTHQDSDHIGSGKKVLDSFQVNCVYRPMQLSSYEVNTLKVPNTNNYAVSTSATYSDVIKAVYTEPNCTQEFTKAGMSIKGEGYSVNFLTPLSVSATTENNDYSPIMSVEYNGAKFLLTGDAESKVEREAVKEYGDLLKADVYKVGHHGSSTSSCQTFLDKVMPKYAVVSAGKDNAYKHPNASVVERLKNIGAQVMTTIDLGTIVMSVDENGKILVLSHDTPNYDMTIVIAVGFVLVLLVWGIRFKKKKTKNKNNEKKLIEKTIKVIDNTKSKK